MCEFKCALLVEMVQAKVLSLLKKTLAKDRTTVTIQENNLPPTTKRFKGSHTDTIPENNLQSGSNYKLIVFLCCKLLPILSSDIRH